MKVLLALLALAATVNGQTECNNARVQFEGSLPACLRAFEGVATLDSDAIDLVCNDTACQAAIETYVGACISNQSVNETVLSQQSIPMLGCIPVGDPDDTICFDVIANVSGGFNTVFSSLGVLSNSCIVEYFMGICSENCMQIITMLTEQLGCCYSEAVRVSGSLATDPGEADTFLSILTRDYFSLCGISQPMFCQNRTIPAPSACSVAVQALFGNEACSVIARQLMTGSEVLNNVIPDPTCIANLLAFSASCNISLDNVGQCEMSAFNLLGPNDDCANSIFTIASNLSTQGNVNISFDVVDRATDNVCGVTGCRNRVSTFAKNCLPANISEMYDVFVLELGCLTNDQGSCFAAQQSGILIDLTNAFTGGACTLAALPGAGCSADCTKVIRSAVEKSGCCVFEFAQAIIKVFPLPGGITVDIDDVFRRCGVTNPGRCMEQTEGTFRRVGGNNTTVDNNNNTTVDNNTTDNPTNRNDNVSGASVTMAYTILCSLLPLLTLIIII